MLSAYLQRYARRKEAFPFHPQDSPRRARRLLDLLGAPDQNLPIVRVIGTKGKGSTAAMLAAVLQCAGCRVGLFTSPHLHSPRERIQVDGAPISRPAFHAGLNALLSLLLESLEWADLGPATLFEGLTALAMAHFARYGVQIAVVEAGMGGRSDATHALAPLLTLLTPIALDHQAYLGDTLSDIAAEKAGAVPPGGMVISAPQAPEVQKVIAERCREIGAVLRWSADAHPGPAYGGPPSPLSQSGTGERAGGETRVGLPGPHQAINAGLAQAAVQALRQRGWRIAEEAIENGLRSVRWPGRLEIVAGRPLTLVDAAHNPAAAAALAAALADRWFTPRPRIMLLGCSADKDLAGIAAALSPQADGAVLTQAQHHRAVDPALLAQLWAARGVPTEVIPSIPQALQRARAWAGPDGLVCAWGSFFVVAEVREALGLAVREPWPEPATASPSPHRRSAPGR